MRTRWRALPKKIYCKVEKVKNEGKKGPDALNCQQRMAKTAQVLSNLNENFFDFFDLAVKNFCGSSLGQGGGGALRGHINSLRLPPQRGKRKTCEAGL
jgi:hypothetical protein